MPNANCRGASYPSTCSEMAYLGGFDFESVNIEGPLLGFYFISKLVANENLL